jgi:cyclin B
MSRIQTDVNEKMRTILIDWLVDVHLKFKLLPETLFLAVEIIDRFLDKKVVSRQKLQLVGVVAMLLAAKYEEIYPPEVKDFIYIAANTYTRDDILRMERLMFSTLDHNITCPTVYVFLKRGLQVMDADLKTHQLSQYLAELSLLEYKLLAHPPSLIGASCIYLANKYLAVKQPWGRVLEHYCQYKLSDVEACAAEILTLSQNAPTQKTQAVRKKYSYAKYGEVAKLTQVAIQIP